MKLVKAGDGVFINLDCMKMFFIEVYQVGHKLNKGEIALAGQIQKYRVKGIMMNGKQAVLKTGLDSVSLAEDWLDKLQKNVIKPTDISELNPVSNIIIP